MGLRTSWRRSVLPVLGITIHNVPGGLAVGVAYGAAAAGLVGEAVLLIRPLLPYVLSFAAGAMVLVVAEELIPDARRSPRSDAATMSVWEASPS
jgi:zinc transporter ZupT